MRLKKEFFFYSLIYLLFTFLLLATANFPFFWDTLQLASKHALYFYDTNFNSIILPNSIDSGHIPSLGIYLAIVWKLFSKSIFLSHLVMLPFVWGIVYQSIQLTKRLFNDKWQFGALIILLADATLLAQCTLVSPDVILVFFFMMALNHFLSHKNGWFAVALVGLALTSMRGMLCVAAFFMADFIIEYQLSIINNQVNKSNKVNRFKLIVSPIFSIIPIYLPVIFIAGSFLIWHYYKTGWIGYHKNMPWYPLFEVVDFKGAIRNVFILGWRLIDFGRLFLWLAGAFCFWHYFKKHPRIDTMFWKLIVVFICVFLVLAQAVIIHKSLSAHRYLLPLYLLSSLLVSYYIFHYVSNIRVRKAIMGIIIVGLLTGNLWVYPDKIAKGWDSTLAYLPYHSLRHKMIQYMQAENIPFNETGSPFPNYGQFRYFDLSESKESFAIKNLETNQYIFYSNVYNDFSNEELFELKHYWIQVKEYNFLQVRVTLYKRPY